LKSWIAEKVENQGGRIRFDRFMELALYDREHGYYAQNVSTVGSIGDFSTGVSIGEALIDSIARWVKSEQSDNGVFNLIELGGGSGRLAAGILRRFPFWKRIDYQIVEVSRSLQEIQRRALRGRKIAWQESLQAALEHVNGEAIIVSNEFVDAFPCRRFARTESGWAEIVLELRDGVWRESLAEPDDIPASSSLRDSFSAGQRIEVHDSYRLWLKGFAPLFRRGSFLTIDYGGAPCEIYARKPNGTIRGFFRHTKVEGKEIYLRPGHQDLTADVNFDDLKTWGSQVGFETINCRTQSEFIATWHRHRSGENEMAAQYMADIDGMGGAFKVLHQRK
jgi:SAM-dependent MidA family methyltransferase